jgi:hypothetical protein
LLLVRVFVQEFEKLTVVRLLAAGCLLLFVRVVVQWLEVFLGLWVFRVLVQV